MNQPRFVARLDPLTVFAADGQAVMFDPRDGGMHLLSEVPWAIVCELQREPIDAATIKQRLQLDYPDDDPAEQTAAVDAALAELLALELIEALDA